MLKQTFRAALSKTNRGMERERRKKKESKIKTTIDP